MNILLSVLHNKMDLTCVHVVCWVLLCMWDFSSELLMNDGEVCSDGSYNQIGPLSVKTFLAHNVLNSHFHCSHSIRQKLL